jgi:tetratricopeptide (TPR) repeat protein
VAAGLALAALLVLGTLGTSIGLVRAWQAEARAKEEAAVATAVRDFLTNDLLAEASPNKNARDKKVTVEEVLGRAAARVAGRFAQQPRVEAEIRLTIGNTYNDLGDLGAAQAHLERALEIGSRVLGDGDPDKLKFVRGLGALYTQQGKFGQAEPLLVRALEGRRRVLGENHPETFAAMNNLGLLYLRQRKFGPAEPLLVRVLEGRRRVLGENHPETFEAMNNLAGVYMGGMTFAQAEELLAKAVEGHHRVLGEEHLQSLVEMMNNLAFARQHQGKLAQAEQLWVETIQLGRRVLGEEHPGTLRATMNLANLYEGAGRFSEKTDLIEQAWARAGNQRTLPEAEHIAFQVYHASNLLERQRFAEAEPLLRECLKFREQDDPWGWQTFNTKSLLGGSLLGQKKFAEAEPLLLAGYEGMKQRGAYPPRLTEATERLVQLYEATGKKEKAAEWRAKLPGPKPPAAK